MLSSRVQKNKGKRYIRACARISSGSFEFMAFLDCFYMVFMTFPHDFCAFSPAVKAKFSAFSPKTVIFEPITQRRGRGCHRYSTSVHRSDESPPATLHHIFNNAKPTSH